MTRKKSESRLFLTVGIPSSKSSFQNNKRGRVADYKSSTVQFLQGTRPWGVAAADVALPCATQNEISKEDAENLINAGVKYIFEGANMPSTPEAIEVFKGNRAVFFPAKVGLLLKVKLTCFF